MVSFVVFISFAIPLLTGSAIYMREAFEDIETVNRLDVVSISVSRIKADLYNRIAANNRKIISLLRTLVILEAAGLSLPQIYPAVKACKKLLRIAITILSFANEKLYSYGKVMLKLAIIKISDANKVVVSADRSYSGLSLRKMNKLELMKKITVPHELAERVSVYIEDRSFKRCSKINFYSYGRSVYSGYNRMINMVSGFLERPYRKVGVKIRGDNMIEGDFAAEIVAAE